MTDWLLTNVPMWLLALLVIVVPSLVAMGAVWWVRRRVGLDALAANNDVGAALFGFTGTVYAIFLGFTVVLVWQEMGDAEAIVNHEATAFVSLYNTAQGLPEPASDRLQQQLRAYILAVRDDEWETMAHGEASPLAEDSLAAVWQTLTQIDPSTEGQSSLYYEAVFNLNELTRQRLLRLQASRDLGLRPLLGRAPQRGAGDHRLRLLLRHAQRAHAGGDDRPDDGHDHGRPVLDPGDGPPLHRRRQGGAGSLRARPGADGQPPLALTPRCARRAPGPRGGRADPAPHSSWRVMRTSTGISG